jgi:cyclase
MRNTRLIARLDVKGSNLIKGVHLEGLKVVGLPAEYARRYYRQGIDEIVYMDMVASLYGRNNLTDIVVTTARDVFVPITVGGGVRSIEAAQQLLKVGADKIAINTAALRRPEIISELAERFGSQCIVLSIEAMRDSKGNWECYTDNGREKTGRYAVEWAEQGAKLGAGEVLLTSIDQEGTRLGFDVELTRAVTANVDIPVIASGGMGGVPHLLDVILKGGADAVAMADFLHYDRQQIPELRSEVRNAGVLVRPV